MSNSCIVRYIAFLAVLALAGCDSDLQMETQAVNVSCEDKLLHPDCADQLSVKDPNTDEGEVLPQNFKFFSLSAQAVDGFINNEEATSLDLAYSYEEIKGVEASFSVWRARSTPCDETLDYPNKSILSISSLPQIDGGYYLCVRLTNAKQGRQVFGRTPIITLDRTVPTIEPIPAMTLGAIAKVTPKITENSKKALNILQTSACVS